MYNYSASKPRLNNCTLTRNSANRDGGGIYNYGYGTIVTNCILWQNNPNQIKGPAAVSYSDIEDVWSGLDNINVDPCFADSGCWVNANDPNQIAEPNDPNAVWIDGNHHLKSQAGRWDPVSESWIQDDVTSPCIDAGDPNSLVGDEPFPNGGIINMGAYGGTAEASKSPEN